MLAPRAVRFLVRPFEGHALVDAVSQKLPVGEAPGLDLQSAGSGRPH